MGFSPFTVGVVVNVATVVVISDVVGVVDVGVIAISVVVSIVVDGTVVDGGVVLVVIYFVYIMRLPMAMPMIMIVTRKAFRDRTTYIPLQDGETWLRAYLSTYFTHVYVFTLPVREGV